MSSPRITNLFRNLISKARKDVCFGVFYISPSREIPQSDQTFSTTSKDIHAATPPPSPSLPACHFRKKRFFFDRSRGLFCVITSYWLFLEWKMLLLRIANISENVRRLMSNFYAVSCILSGPLVSPPFSPFYHPPTRRSFHRFSKTRESS